jgi:hypothetical protein
MGRQRRWLVALGVALSGAFGCGASPAQRAAVHGDQGKLAEAIARGEAAGTLSLADASALARAVAARELRAAGPDAAIERVHDLVACAHELDSELADRMTIHDAAGAEAALARVEAHVLGIASARTFINDPEACWRAVGARGLVRDEDRDGRVRSFVDPEPAIRRAAVRAARDAADPADVTPLLEVARVDPDPLIRTEAVRAIAAMRPSHGEDVTLALVDLWTTSDDPLRADVAVAWESRGLWGAGGREALRLVAAEQHGPGAIAAALAILRHRDAGVDATSIAAAQLARAIDAGSPAARLQAIAQAPLEPASLLAALQRAARDDNLPLRVAALARLASSGDGSARVALEALGQPESSVAEPARLALAMMHDRRVQAWLEHDLVASAPEERLGAAVALASLGAASRAAPLLADPIPAIRARAACTILVSARSQ